MPQLAERQPLAQSQFHGSTELMTDYLTTREAADEAGFTENYVRILIRKGKVKAKLKGRQYWIDADSFRGYLDAMKELGTQRFNWRREDNEEITA